MIGAGDSGGGVGRDLTACDREPIHIPGAIQPHGMLLIADGVTLRVVGVAGDVEALLASRWQNRTLDSLLGVDVGALLAAREDPNDEVAIFGVDGLAGRFDAIVRRGGPYLLVELEPQEPALPSSAEILARLDAIVSAFERTLDLQRLCERAAVAFRELTGFDRVMVYRFLDDAAGAVVAEDRDPALSSFLNHHFPASDIPKQARALYVRNRVRVIPDASYTPAPIRGEAGLSEIDLSDVSLRSVSPIHLQFLHNMGVCASASMSIVKDGLLWGLIACHHNTPRRLSYAMRVATRALAGGLSRQIRAKEEAETYRERLRLRGIEDSIVARYDRDAPLSVFARQMGSELAQMVSADGFAMLHGHDLVVSGICPPEPALRRLARTVAPLAATRPFASSSLARHAPTLVDIAETASGVIAAVLEDEQRAILLWVRAEKREIVNWAGNPHKDIALDPQGILNPRTSFEAWSEETRSRARRWTREEVESVARLRNALHEASQQRRMRTLNQELVATIAGRDALLVQKDQQLREVDSRVQTSLQVVDALLGDASRRLAAVARVHRGLQQDAQPEAVDLATYLGDLIEGLHDAMAAEEALAMVVDLTPIAMAADRAMQIGLLLTELVTNAWKHAYAGRPGPLAISLERLGAQFRLVVADKGRGTKGASAGTGFGMQMIGAVVEELGGTVAHEDNRPGLRVIVSAPIAAA